MALQLGKIENDGTIGGINPCAFRDALEAIGITGATEEMVEEVIASAGESTTDTNFQEVCRSIRLFENSKIHGIILGLNYRFMCFPSAHGGLA